MWPLGESEWPIPEKQNNDNRVRQGNWKQGCLRETVHFFSSDQRWKKRKAWPIFFYQLSLFGWKKTQWNYTTGRRLLYKVCCKNMYQAECGLERLIALPRGLGRQVLFTMIDWQFWPSGLSTVYKSICLMKSCKMSTPLIHKKHIWNTTHISIMYR